MPELPEVEIVVRRLRKPVVGRTIRAVDGFWEPMFRPSLVEVATRLPGNRIESVDRRGKYLVFALSNQERLVIHLKMTGDLYVTSEAEPLDDHDRVVFHFEGGDQLRFKDPRKFGRVYFISEIDDFLGRLGPEPLDMTFSEDHFFDLVAQRSAQIKPLLLNQAFIAGIGNIYASEILFSAGIHPARSTHTLNENEKRRLYWSIRQVLTLALENEGSSLSDEAFRDGRHQNHFDVYGRQDKPCPMCGTSIQRAVFGQRSTFFCPRCQPQKHLGVVYA